MALLREAAASEDPAMVFGVTQKAIASAVTVILRADDSSGIIGDAIRDMLDLHADLAQRAAPSPAKLVAWLIGFQFDGRQDFFTLDPAAYALALGERGLALYQAKLDEIAGRLGHELTEAEERQLWERRLSDPEEWRRSADDRHTRFVLEYNARRLAVIDRDVEAIIRTHVRDRKVAAWGHDTAKALAEIGEHELAIDWAKQAADFDLGHQAKAAADYWCQLLEEHREPDEALEARHEVFRRWPASDTAARLYGTAGSAWTRYDHEVLETLAQRPREAVPFMLLTLGDVGMAWDLAHSLGLEDADLWYRLAKAYEKTDPLAVLPVLARLVETDLITADARNYQTAARRLKTMRRLAAGTDKATEVDELIAELRTAHRRRPRLLTEFDRADLP